MGENIDTMFSSTRGLFEQYETLVVSNLVFTAIAYSPNKSFNVSYFRDIRSFKAEMASVRLRKRQLDVKDSGLQFTFTAPKGKKD